MFAAKSFKLVLDYDGVIFKNTHAMEAVSNRSAKFVSKKLKMSYNNARLVNAAHYKVHGHTVKYLQHIGVDTTLEEYNDFVFNNIDWNDIASNIKDDDFEQIIDVYLLNKLQVQKCVLFSNAPRLWVDKTLEALDIQADELFEKVFTCETLDQLKPNMKVYDEIEKHYPYTDFIFIDDSILNIQGLGERWKSHLFIPEENLYQCGYKMLENEYINVENLETILYPDLDFDFDSNLMKK
jgi:FMN phosphatase YigB (HAD superfamily)